MNIRIGYIPILDHLVLGIAHAQESFDSFTLEPVPFNNWDELVGALKQHDIDGAFVLAPLALRTFREGTDLRLLLLGHREGQVLVTRPDITSIAELKGRTVHAPHKDATHHLLLKEALQQEGLAPGTDATIDLAYETIRDVPERFLQQDIDAFMIAEPVGTELVARKKGHVLGLSRDMKEHHIDCVFVMHQDIIQTNESATQELIDAFVRAGMFATAYPRKAAEIAVPFLQNYWTRKLILHALSHDEGHILYWDLIPRQEDLDYIDQLAEKHLDDWIAEPPSEAFLEPSYAQTAYRSWQLQERISTKDKGTQRTLAGSLPDALRSWAEFDPSLAVAIVQNSPSSKGTNNTTPLFRSFSEAISSALNGKTAKQSEEGSQHAWICTSWKDEQITTTPSTTICIRLTEKSLNVLLPLLGVATEDVPEWNTLSQDHLHTQPISYWLNSETANGYLLTNERLFLRITGLWQEKRLT